MTVGEKIRILRNRSGCTQEEFAELLGVSTNTVSCWERGIYLPKNVYLKMMEMLFSSFDISFRSEK